VSAPDPSSDTGVTQRADSAGAWQAPITLKHGLKTYDKEL